MNKRLAVTAVIAATTLLGGCAVYPAYPGYATGPVAPQVVAPVYVAPAPVAVYPSIGFYGRWGGHHRH